MVLITGTYFFFYKNCVKGSYVLINCKNVEYNCHLLAMDSFKNVRTKPEANACLNQNSD